MHDSAVRPRSNHEDLRGDHVELRQHTLGVAEVAISLHWRIELAEHVRHGIAFRFSDRDPALDQTGAQHVDEPHSTSTSIAHSPTSL